MERPCSSRRSTCRGAPFFAAWAPPWRCRSSTRWCRRRRRSRKTAAAPKTRLAAHRDGARLRRQHAVRHRQAHCGRRRRTARDFDFTPTLQPLEPFRDYLTIVSDTDLRQRRGVHGAGDRRRPLPLERGVPDRSRTRSRPRARISSPASRSIRSTRRSSARTRRCRRCSCASRTSTQSGACGYGYACVYTDAISWASPTEPLPMIRDPRVVFEQSVRRRRHAGGARAARQRAEPQHPRLHHARGRAPAEGPRRRRPQRGSTSYLETSARSSGASRRSSSTTRAARRASCRRRRSACPIPSTSTSS